MKTITLRREDHEKLVKLWEATITTPVIYTSPGRSWADSAVDEMRAFMDELGKRYGYNPQTARISRDTSTFEAEDS
ncbi:MAG TPA: hypothetical protein VEZ43_01385 [Dongiaceae bacterium]|nr:hypothetical protein [Dongiaceae bacterium]